MNNEEYKRLITENDVLDYGTIDITLKEVISKQEFELANKLQRILKNNEIKKPDLHLSPSEITTSYYRIDLSSDDIEKLVDIFFDLEVSHIGINGETTPAASLYASLVDKWNRLI